VDGLKRPANWEEDSTNSNRRRLIGCMGLALAAPLPALAQPRRPRIAWMGMASRSIGVSILNPLLEGLAALGYVPGRNLELAEFWADSSREKLEANSLEAAQARPALFISQGLALSAVRKVSGATPVVFGMSADPVEAGIAKTIARPGGTFTGVSFLAYTLVGKRVELLKQVAPAAKKLGVLSNSEHRGDAKELVETHAAATGLGMQVAHFPATNAAEVERALAAIAAAKCDALVVHPDGLMVEQRAAIARFSLDRRVPMVSGWAVLADAGGLLTYGPVLSECYRRLAYFVDRILRGAKPADLPIEMPSVFELVINMPSARALGIHVPASLLVRADRVIQ
jgi:putative ABC transport system substrate-binding protein